MKKLLLPALLLAGASFANAEQVVLLSEDFEWLEPWSSQKPAGQTVETNNPDATAQQLGTNKVDEVSTIEALEAAGYKFVVTCAASKSPREPKAQIYLQKNYLKFGLTGYYSGIVLKPVEQEASENVVISFDYSSMRQGSGKWDPTKLVVVVTNGTEEQVFDVPAHEYADGEAYAWHPVSVELGNVLVNANTEITIRNRNEDWPPVDGSAPALRWFIDNIKLTAEVGGGEEPAEGVVFFEDDFSWLAPWAEADGLGDPVGTDNPTAKVVQTMNSSLVNNETIYSHMTDKSLCPANNTLGGWPSPGYLYRMWPNSAWYTIYAADGYFQVGGEGQTGGLRTPSFRVTEEEADDLWLEFDWCPVKNANGEYAATSLYIEARPGNICIADGLTCELSTGDPYEWKHEEINLFDAGMTPAEACNVIIQSVEHGGNTNFYLDNIRVASSLHGPGTGVNGIVVEDNSNAPVEYYNLQGVRIANPENGLYIRRQGNKVSKVIL